MPILGGCIGRGALVELAAFQIPSWYNGRKKKAPVTWCFLLFPLSDTVAIYARRWFVQIVSPDEVQVNDE